MARQSWTDDRLDDLSHRMDERFDRVEGEIKGARVEMRTTAKELRGEIKTQGDELRGEIKTQGDELRGEIKTQGDELRGEIKGLGRELREEMARLHDDNRQMNVNLLELQQTMIRIGWAGVIALIGTLAAVLIPHL